MPTQDPKPPEAASTKGREKNKKAEKRKAEPSADAWKILLHPLLTEKSIGLVEAQNKLVFSVRPDANKNQIRWAVENSMAVKVDSINTLIDRDGRKKATIKLAKEFKAADIATRFGML
jgi:large subunit ribosomal protein L23